MGVIVWVAEYKGDSICLFARDPLSDFRDDQKGMEEEGKPGRHQFEDAYRMLVLIVIVIVSVRGDNENSHSRKSF